MTADVGYISAHKLHLVGFFFHEFITLSQVASVDCLSHDHPICLSCDRKRG
uniref:Uncharacterized protein n=1 Tax=Anguilla anguilla TaxID=7936 RepID=A0A0E9W6M8_ANGAN